MFNIIVANDTVLIESTTFKEIGIVGTIESYSQDQPQLGKVISIGLTSYIDDDPAKGRKEMPLSVKEGDAVAYIKYGEHKFLIAGKKYLFVKMADLLSVIKKTDGGEVK